MSYLFFINNKHHNSININHQHLQASLSITPSTLHHLPPSPSSAATDICGASMRDFRAPGLELGDAEAVADASCAACARRVAKRSDRSRSWRPGPAGDVTGPGAGPKAVAVLAGSSHGRYHGEMADFLNNLSEKVTIDCCGILNLVHFTVIIHGQSGGQSSSLKYESAPRLHLDSFSAQVSLSLLVATPSSSAG